MFVNNKDYVLDTSNTYFVYKIVHSEFVSQKPVFANSMEFSLLAK